MQTGLDDFRSPFHQYECLVIQLHKKHFSMGARPQTICQSGDGRGTDCRSEREKTRSADRDAVWMGVWCVAREIIFKKYERWKLRICIFANVTGTRWLGYLTYTVQQTHPIRSLVDIPSFQGRGSWQMPPLPCPFLRASHELVVLYTLCTLLFKS